MTILQSFSQYVLWSADCRVVILVPLMMMALWIHQADTAGGLGGAGGAAAGLSRLDLARYFLSAFVVRQFTIAWVVFSFEEDALQGRLSPMLLQPLHPLWRYLSAHLAEQATRFPFVMGLMALFLLMVPWAFWIPPPGRLVQTVLATGLAFAVNFLVQSLIAVLCFWSERASALERLHTLAMLFLSGLMAPLEVFPPAMRHLASWTPFPWVVHFPARLLAGAEMNVGQGFAAHGSVDAPADTGGLRQRHHPGVTHGLQQVGHAPLHRPIP